MLTSEAYDLIREFQVKNNQVVGESILEEDMALLRSRLILEELGELAIALHELPQDHERVDLEQVADALADLFYVVVGAGVTVGEVVKVRWLEPALLAPSHGFRTEILKNLTRGVFEVVDRLNFDSRQNVLDHLQLRESLGRLAWGISLAAVTVRVPLREVFLEVHRSNMTKDFGKTQRGDKGDKDPNYRKTYEPPRLREILAGAKP